MPDGLISRIRAALLVLVLTGCLSAAQITFITTPVAAGWQNDYTFTGFSFAAGDDLQLFFDPAEYDQLLNGVALPVSDWDLLLIQPQPAVPDNGRYDLLAVVDGPSFSGTFSIQYTVTGNAPPVAQPWQVVHFNSDFQPGPVLGSGTATTSGIPEPATIWFGITGLMLIVLGTTCPRRGR